MCALVKGVGGTATADCEAPYSLTVRNDEGVDGGYTGGGRGKGNAGLRQGEVARLCVHGERGMLKLTRE